MKGLDRIPKFSTGSIPVFALIGRNDYVMGAPLAKASSDVLTSYDPDVVHLVSPDILGFSAQRWVRDNGVCAVCTYHTQIDRYVRFYTAKHSLLDKLRPRIAVQKLFSTFYGGCDVVAVPNSAIADKLVLKMGIPRAKIGLFPYCRGVLVLLRPEARRWRAGEITPPPRHRRVRPEAVSSAGRGDGVLARSTPSMRPVGHAASTPSTWPSESLCVM